MQTPTCRGRAQGVACLTALSNQMKPSGISNDWLSGDSPRTAKDLRRLGPRTLSIVSPPTSRSLSTSETTMVWWLPSWPRLLRGKDPQDCLSLTSPPDDQVEDPQFCLLICVTANLAKKCSASYPGSCGQTKGSFKLYLIGLMRGSPLVLFHSRRVSGEKAIQKKQERDTA